MARIPVLPEATPVGALPAQLKRPTDDQIRPLNVDSDQNARIAVVAKCICKREADIAVQHLQSRRAFVAFGRKKT